MKTIFTILTFLFLTSVALGQAARDGLAQGAKENKYVLMFFHATWCGPCKQLEQQTLSAIRVRNDIKGYIVQHYDIDRDKESFLYAENLIPPLQQQHAVPFYVLVNPHNAQAIRWGYGYRSPTEFKRWLQTNQ